MAKDVAQALKRMLTKALRLSEQQAEEYFFQLKVRCDTRGCPSRSHSVPGWDTEAFSHTPNLEGCHELLLSRMLKEKSFT